MADPAGLIRAFFADQQPTLRLPDGTWFGDRPNDVMHDLHSLRFEPDQVEIELGGELVRSAGGGLRLVLDGAVDAREIRGPGVHELELRGFDRCVLHGPGGNRREWRDGTLTFVRWVAQGRTPRSVLSSDVD